MSLTRTTLLAGPAAVTYNQHTYWARDGILVTPALELQPLTTDAQGLVDSTVVTRPVQIEFTPSAPFADLAALYGGLALRPGQSLFGPVDLPLVITSVNGLQLVFSAVALTRPPDLHLASREVVAGAVAFVAHGARLANQLALGRTVTLSQAAPPLPPRFAPQLADDFSITWRLGAPWNKLRSRAGVQLRFLAETEPVSSDANSPLDLTLRSWQIEARFTPVSPAGPAEGDILQALLQEGYARPGHPLSATAAELAIAGTHLQVTLPAAQLTRADLLFNALHPRVGELTFVANRAQLDAGPNRPLAQLSEGLPLLS